MRWPCRSLLHFSATMPAPQSDADIQRSDIPITCALRRWRRAASTQSPGPPKRFRPPRSTDAGRKGSRFRSMAAREGSRPDEPRSVGILRGRKELDALLIHVVSDSHACLVQRNQRLSRRIRIRIQVRQLRPSSRRRLPAEQCPESPTLIAEGCALVHTNPMSRIARSSAWRASADSSQPRAFVKAPVRSDACLLGMGKASIHARQRPYD